MNIELWWPKLKPSTREWLIQNNGDSVPPDVVSEITQAGGPDASDSQSGQSGFSLSVENTDWIETVANEEEPT